MGVEVRTITEDELEAWAAAMTRGFMRASVPEGDLEYRRSQIRGRSIVGRVRRHVGGRDAEVVRDSADAAWRRFGDVGCAHRGDRHSDASSAGTAHSHARR